MRTLIGCERQRRICRLQYPLDQSPIRSRQSSVRWLEGPITIHTFTHLSTVFFRYSMSVAVRCSRLAPLSASLRLSFRAASISSRSTTWGGGGRGGGQSQRG